MAAPTSVQAGAVGRNAMGLTWSAVAGATTYELVARDITTGVITGPIPAAAPPTA